MEVIRFEDNNIHNSIPVKVKKEIIIKDEVEYNHGVIVEEELIIKDDHGNDIEHM